MTGLEPATSGVTGRRCVELRHAVTCLVTFVSLGLVGLYPLQLWKFARNVAGISFGSLVRDPDDPSRPKTVKMEIAKEVLDLVSHMSPRAITVLVALSLSVASIVFGITYLAELAEVILVAAGGAVRGAYNRIKKWIGRLDEP